MALVDVAPPKLIQVLVDDTWRDGHLRAWQRHEDRWRGYVRYSAGVGQQRLGWVSAATIRPSAV